MSLIKLLRRNVWVSFAASGLQLLSTLATIHFAGASAFADLTVDIFKLAVIAIFLEVVPTPYATIRSQREPEFGSHMATFAMASSLFCLGGWAAMAGAGLLSNPSIWMAPYALYLGLQRYLDIKLQVENRVDEYYQMLCISAGLRLLFTVVGLSAIQGHDVDILWAALSLSSLLSVIVWILWKPRELHPFLRRGHRTSVLALYSTRDAYYPYYVNTVLKRIRDSLLPVAASFVVSDKLELARYLLAMRGVEFAMGQVRIVEALLANLDNRAAVQETRRRHLLYVAVIAQFATFAVCIFLAGQADFGVRTLIVSAIASLFAYPYIIEIGFRSDAYAEDAPLRVTISYAAFAVTLAVVLFALTRFGFLNSYGLISAPVLAQTVAGITYFFSRRLVPSKHPVAQAAGDARSGPLRGVVSPED